MQPRYLTLIVKPTHRCNLHCPYCYDFKFKQNIGIEFEKTYNQEYWEQNKSDLY